jgi:hypothetical protein
MFHTARTFPDVCSFGLTFPVMMWLILVPGSSCWSGQTQKLDG